MFSSISLEELQHLLGGTKPVSNEELQQEIAQAVSTTFASLSPI